MSDKKPITRVRDVMTSPINSIDGMATVEEALKIMKNCGASSIVVERRNEDDEFGLLVVSDIAKKVIAENRAPARVNVYEIMSKPVMPLPEEMNITYAIRLLVNFGLSRALVVGHDRLPIGLVTLRDMVFRISS